MAQFAFVLLLEVQAVKRLGRDDASCVQVGIDSDVMKLLHDDADVFTAGLSHIQSMLINHSSVDENTTQ